MQKRHKHVQKSLMQSSWFTHKTYRCWMFLFLSPNELGTAHLIIAVKKRSFNVRIWQQLTTKTTKIRLRYSNRAERYFGLNLLLLITTFTYGKLKSELFWRLISTIKHINWEIFVMRHCLNNCNGIITCTGTMDVQHN